MSYNAENPAVEIEIPTISLPEAVASPKSRGALPRTGQAHPIIVDGSIRADSVRGATVVRVEFWQQHPRYGHLTTNEFTGHTTLSDDGTMYTYRLSGTTPHGVGIHNFEVSVMEYIRDPEAPDALPTAVGPSVIATGTMEIK